MSADVYAEEAFSGRAFVCIYDGDMLVSCAVSDETEFTADEGTPIALTLSTDAEITDGSIRIFILDSGMNPMLDVVQTVVD